MSQQFAQGHALLVGVGADLPNTVDDAVGLADLLKDPERCAYPAEQVHLLTGDRATRQNILSGLAVLADTSRSESTVLVYFSGHGYRVKTGAGAAYYLMPFGYQLNELEKTAISGAEFAAALRAIPAQKLLVLLDCCHAGGVGDAKAAGIEMSNEPLPPEALALLAEGTGRALIASSMAAELSYAGRPYSAFTLALFEALCGVGVAQQDGFVRVADLALHARETVPSRTRQKQHPILNYQQADNFAVAYYAAADARPKALPFTQTPRIELEPDGVNVVVKVYPHFQASPARLRRSFDALMAGKLQGFVGRQFVFDAFDSFIRDCPSGYFVIRGAPGIGKTALMAKLISDRGYVHHFNIASQNIRSTRAFLENVCAQLIARYALPYEQLPPSAGDDSGFLMQCLAEAAARSQNQPVIVAVDSLDEADRLGTAPSVNTLYLPSSLPQAVYFVLTTRPLQDLHLHVTQQRTLELSADSEGNLRDIEAYIAHYAEREVMRTRLSEWKVEPVSFVEALRIASQGNFMYLYYVLPAIERGAFAQNTLDELPEGLMSYYQRHWRQMRAGNEADFESVYAPIVCILGVAQEPLTIDQIAAWTRLSRGRVREAIGMWREFLEEEQLDGQRRFRIYHASFQDFLKDNVDLAEYDDMIAQYYLALLSR